MKNKLKLTTIVVVLTVRSMAVETAVTHTRELSPEEAFRTYVKALQLERTCAITYGLLNKTDSVVEKSECLSQPGSDNVRLWKKQTKSTGSVSTRTKRLVTIDTTVLNNASGNWTIIGDRAIKWPDQVNEKVVELAAHGEAEFAANEPAAEQGSASYKGQYHQRDGDGEYRIVIEYDNAIMERKRRMFRHTMEKGVLEKPVKFSELQYKMAIRRHLKDTDRYLVSRQEYLIAERTGLIVASFAYNPHGACVRQMERIHPRVTAASDEQHFEIPSGVMLCFPKTLTEFTLACSEVRRALINKQKQPQ